MKIVRDALFAALVSSCLIGVQILAYDTWLWFAEPSHAYGLVGFVAVDMVLAVALLWRVSLAAIGAIIMAMVQFGAMLTDAVAGQPTGVPAVAFKSYLLNNYSFVGLLIVQVVILIVALGELMTPIVHRHGHWTEILHNRKR